MVISLAHLLASALKIAIVLAIILLQIVDQDAA
jgi:hypothetical protein